MGELWSSISKLRQEAAQGSRLWGTRQPWDMDLVFIRCSYRPLSLSALPQRQKIGLAVPRWLAYPKHDKRHIKSTFFVVSVIGVTVLERQKCHFFSCVRTVCPKHISYWTGMFCQKANHSNLSHHDSCSVNWNSAPSRKMNHHNLLYLHGVFFSEIVHCLGSNTWKGDGLRAWPGVTGTEGLNPHLRSNTAALAPAEIKYSPSPGSCTPWILWKASPGIVIHRECKLFFSDYVKLPVVFQAICFKFWWYAVYEILWQ